MKFIIFDFRKYFNLGDFVTILDLSEKYYRITGKQPYVIAMNLNKNKAITTMISDYQFIHFIQMNTILGFLKILFILFKSIFIKYTYCIYLTRNKIKKIILIFVYCFTRSQLIIYNFDENNYRDPFFKESKNTKNIINSKLDFLRSNNLLLSKILNKEIEISQNFLYKKNNIIQENDLIENNYIGLVLSASSLNKSIKVEDYLYIVKRLWSKYQTTFVFLGLGNKYELMIANELKFFFDENKISYKNLLGEKNFYNTLNILDNSFLNIGPNTGLILISFYMNKKTVTFSEHTSNFFTFKSQNSIFIMNPENNCSCQKKIIMDADKEIDQSRVGCCMYLLDIKKEMDNIISNNILNT
ncbi:MAG: hypothetical protein QG630_439 [Patescibacteria group bacterium]|nr:hypothetical protein [Patescibacteria group bacterium]